MGNSSSTTTPGDGIPFVSWKTPLHDNTKSPLAHGRKKRSDSIPSHASLTALVSGGVTTYHFAEASCYKYDKCPRLVTAPMVFTNPPKADGELRNVHELVGAIAVVERGGRVHFPDIVRRVRSAGAVGCIFLERTAASTTAVSTVLDNAAAAPGNTETQRSLYDGFHSSGRQSVTIPIVLLSKYHADQLHCDKPSRVSIEFLSNEQAISHIVPEDDVVVIASAARAGEVEVLKHVLYADTTGSIRERLSKATALCDAAEHGHVDCIELLHGFGISLDEQKLNGTTALMMTCSVGNVEAARALLMFGANVDLEDVHGLTAVMIAVRDGHVPCLKLLIRKQAQINLSRNRNRGTTALHIAARGGQEECVSILIEAGAALDIQSPNYTTALMEAARAGNLGCVKLLANAGASLDAKDREGQTAEVLARTFGHTAIEDFLRERAESESVKDHRRKIEETVANPTSTLTELLSLAMDSNITVDILQREMTRDVKYTAWLEQPRIIYEVFRLLTRPIDRNASAKNATALDPQYGHYKVQHFCCELSLWYTRRIFQQPTHEYRGQTSLSSSLTSTTSTTANRHGFSFGFHTCATDANDEDAFDHKTSFGYFKVLFHFVCTATALDEVLLVLFCKVLHHFILALRIGPLLLAFLADEGRSIVPWLVTHIGLDSIRDVLVWLLYSDMSECGQAHIRTSGLLEALFARLYAWQRTLSWGVGTSYQRDAIENICLLVNYIIYPPAVYVMGDVATFVENTDHTLPLITDQYYPTSHNELLKTLLLCGRTSELSFGTLIDLGFAEVFRQATHVERVEWVVLEGGTLSIAMMVMSTLGYHKRQRDATGIETLLEEVKVTLLHDLRPRVAKFVQLCHALVVGDEAMLRTLMDVPATQRLTTHAKGSALLNIITFLKRCTFLQDPIVNQILAEHGMMPSLLRCFAVHPTNNLLHHELTDVIRFVLLDPDQKRSPSCPLLHSLFQSPANVLDFVTKSYDAHVQYKGHLTTIANSIFTLTNTPVYRREGTSLTCQEMVYQHTSVHTNWTKFETVLATQNLLEMQPLGQRNAPLCDGCLKLKHHALEFVSTTLSGEVKFTGYLETLFSATASHYCKLKATEDFITGFLYKKDKIHDHIPIPEPTRVSSFIQFPVPMPFHALTFTITYFGLCRQCDKLWYCDTLQSPNWATRMKWVIPTSVRKWYSFGVAEGPNSGAHGIQFSTKGYKNFIVLTDTWGRQEQWMRAMDEAIIGLSSQAVKRMDAANAMAIQIDNEVEPSEFELKATKLKPMATTTDNVATTAGGESNAVAAGRGREKHDKTRKRSNTISESTSEMEKRDHAFSSSDEESDTDSESEGGDTSNKSIRRTRREARNTKSNPGLRMATESALKTGKPLPASPSIVARSPSSSSSLRRSESVKSKIDLKQFQEDTKRYTEILAKLKRTALARDSNNTIAPVHSPIATKTSTRSRTARRLSTSASSQALASLDKVGTTTCPTRSTRVDSNEPLPKTLGMRLITSSRDLASMKDSQ